MKTSVAIPVAIAAMFLMDGCLSLRAGGGKKTNAQNKSDTYRVTLVQQLEGMKKAYDDGVISKREYDQQRRKLMKDY